MPMMFNEDFGIFLCWCRTSFNAMYVQRLSVFAATGLYKPTGQWISPFWGLQGCGLGRGSDQKKEIQFNGCPSQRYCKGVSQYSSAGEVLFLQSPAVMGPWLPPEVIPPYMRITSRITLIIKRLIFIVFIWPPFYFWYIGYRRRHAATSGRSKSAIRFQGCGA